MRLRLTLSSLKRFKELYEDAEFYLVSLKDMADRDSDLPQSELERFFDKGVELGIFNARVVETIPKVEATPLGNLGRRIVEGGSAKGL